MIAAVDDQMDPETAAPSRSDTIVVGHDDSSGADAALETALALASALHLRLLVVRAWTVFTAPPGSIFHDGFAVPLDEVGERVRADLIARAGPTSARHPEVHVEYRAVFGQAADVLIVTSRTARLLIVGSRGHGGFASLLLGSVSNQCAHHASCSVLISRPTTNLSAPGALGE